MTDHPAPSICRSCGAKILWVELGSTRRMPVDAEPVEGGNVLLRGGFAEIIKPQEVLPGTPLYKSHFATCPHADQHRKRE